LTGRLTVRGVREQLRPLATRAILSWGDAKELSLKLEKFDRR